MQLVLNQLPLGRHAYHRRESHLRPLHATTPCVASRNMLALLKLFFGAQTQPS